MKRGRDDSPIIVPPAERFYVGTTLNVGDNGFAREPQFRQIPLHGDPNQLPPRFLGHHRREQHVPKHGPQDEPLRIPAQENTVVYHVAERPERNKSAKPGLSATG